MSTGNSKSSVTEKFVNKIRELDDLVGNLSSYVIGKNQDTLEECLSAKSKDLDSVMKDLEYEVGGNYVSGDIGLVASENDECYIECNLYFLKADKTWVKKVVTGKKNKIQWVLTPEDQDKLRREKSVRYEYNR